MRCVLDEEDIGFLEWVREKAEFEGKFDQEMSFLKARLVALEKEKEHMWRKGFTLARNLGKFGRRVEFEKVGLHLTKERPYQLIMTEQPDSLQAILGKIDGLI